MTKPPPALDGALVIAFAVADETVKYEERQTLFINGELLGRVPKLAICRNLDETEFMVFHCNGDWEVLAVTGGYESVAAAKSRAGLSYHGIDTKWVSTGYKKEDATSYLERLFKGDSCTFCGKNPLQLEAMVQAVTVAGDTVRICNHCVDEFYSFLHAKTVDQ